MLSKKFQEKDEFLWLASEYKTLKAEWVINRLEW